MNLRVTIQTTAAQLKTYLGRGRKTGGAPVRELRPHIARAADQSHIYCPRLCTPLRCLGGYCVLRRNPATAVLGTNLSTGCGGN